MKKSLLALSVATAFLATGCKWDGKTTDTSGIENKVDAVIASQGEHTKQLKSIKEQNASLKKTIDELTSKLATSESVADALAKLVSLQKDFKKLEAELKVVGESVAGLSIEEVLELAKAHGVAITGINGKLEDYIALEEKLKAGEVKGLVAQSLAGESTLAKAVTEISASIDSLPDSEELTKLKEFFEGLKAKRVISLKELNEITEKTAQVKNLIKESQDKVDIALAAAVEGVTIKTKADFTKPNANEDADDEANELAKKFLMGLYEKQKTDLVDIAQDGTVSNTNGKSVKAINALITDTDFNAAYAGQKDVISESVKNILSMRKDLTEKEVDAIVAYITTVQQ